MAPNHSRNFFTQEEDEILLRALCKPGVKLSGNAVYNELAEAVRISNNFC